MNTCFLMPLNFCCTSELRLFNVNYENIKQTAFRRLHCSFCRSVAFFVSIFESFFATFCKDLETKAQFIRFCSLCELDFRSVDSCLWLQCQRSVLAATPFQAASVRFIRFYKEEGNFFFPLQLVIITFNLILNTVCVCDPLNGPTSFYTQKSDLFLYAPFVQPVSTHRH